ncbi:MAG: Pvc16 family protein [Synechococcales bacterium]|nr:Pvc16 family protein [Synechococcales bacterium]
MVAATQTLAEFLSSALPLIEKDSISFEHPRVAHHHKPCLNLYCYHIQKSQEPQWLDLIFLVSAIDHTVLAEQHLLSEMVTVLSGYQSLPEQVLMPELRGLGALPIQVSNQTVPETLLLWQVLQTPLRLSLQVTLTVPIRDRVALRLVAP